MGHGGRAPTSGLRPHSLQPRCMQHVISSMLHPAIRAPTLPTSCLPQPQLIRWSVDHHWTVRAHPPPPLNLQPPPGEGANPCRLHRHEFHALAHQAIFSGKCGPTWHLGGGVASGRARLWPFLLEHDNPIGGGMAWSACLPKGQHTECFNSLQQWPFKGST